MSTSYAWIIDEDRIGDGTDAGVSGPRGRCAIPKDKTSGVRFRMKDDDGEVYYIGRLFGEFDGFEPLDDFGTPNAGCTSIEMREADGHWTPV